MHNPKSFFNRAARSLQSVVGFAAAILVLVATETNAAETVRTHELFDQQWRFHLGDVDRAERSQFDDSSWRQLDLPHDWSVEFDFSKTNASATGFLPGGIGWYRKSFESKPDWSGKRVFVTFDGVHRNADVWINGHHLGQRPYGYITFQHDLTPYLVTNGVNVLAVRVERENVADSRWYPGSGIYRHVWLTVTKPVHVPLWGNFVRTPRVVGGMADVVASTEVKNDSAKEQSVRVLWQVIQPDGKTAAEFAQTERVAKGETHTFSRWQKVADAQLWSPDSPALYTLVSRVFAGNELVDETRTSFGIRTFYFDANKGFFLNGQNMKIKGLCMHHDAGVVGAAVPEDVLERRLRIVKEFGGNAIRCSHNPMAPEFYSLCDRLGLLVMDEAFDEWEIGKRKWVEGRNAGSAQRFGYSEDFEEWAEQDCADMVRRGRNHPSIIMWSIGNEIDYPTDPYVLDETRTVEGFARDSKQPQQTRLTVVAPKLIAAIKRHDPTRPVTMALANVTSSDATGLAQMLDVVGYNYQESGYAKDHEMFPTRIIYGSENGRNFDQWKAVRDNDYVSAQFLWVGFDFLGEANEWPNHGSQAGLFDTRGFPKTLAHYRKALWSDEPMVYPVVQREERGGGRRSRGFGVPSWSWPDAEGRTMTVRVFSNCEEVELLLNGKSVGRNSVGEDRIVSFEVPYAPGTLRAVGLKQSQPAASVQLVTAGAAASLKIELDREKLPANGRSVAHATISIVDAAGNRVPDAGHLISVSAEGQGKLLGLDNGDMNDTTALRSLAKAAVNGQALALLQAGRTEGVMTLKASAPGLESASVTAKVE